MSKIDLSSPLKVLADLASDEKGRQRLAGALLLESRQPCPTLSPLFLLADSNFHLPQLEIALINSLQPDSPDPSVAFTLAAAALRPASPFAFMAANTLKKALLSRDPHSLILALQLLSKPSFKEIVPSCHTELNLLFFSTWPVLEARARLLAPPSSPPFSTYNVLATIRACKADPRVIPLNLAPAFTLFGSSVDGLARISAAKILILAMKHFPESAVRIEPALRTEIERLTGRWFEESVSLEVVVVVLKEVSDEFWIRNFDVVIKALSNLMDSKCVITKGEVARLIAKRCGGWTRLEKMKSKKDEFKSELAQRLFDWINKEAEFSTRKTIDEVLARKTSIRKRQNSKAFTESDYHQTKIYKMSCKNIEEQVELTKTEKDDFYQFCQKYYI